MLDLTLAVAEYLLMSSEHKQYSLDNQHAVIAASVSGPFRSLTRAA